MINREKIKGYLEEIAKTHPNIATGKLELGSRVKESSGRYYEIDDLDIDRRLGEFPEGVVPYGPIHRALKSSQQEIFLIFNDSSLMPFSRVYESGIGACVAKAILVQLSAQRVGDAFLINGVFAEDSEVGIDRHAYNVVFRQGKPFLIDAENPLAKDAEGKITHAYTAPIIGIEDGDFKVQKEWRQGRTYSLS